MLTLQRQNLCVLGFAGSTPKFWLKGPDMLGYTYIVYISYIICTYTYNCILYIFFHIDIHNIETKWNAATIWLAREMWLSLVLTWFLIHFCTASVWSMLELSYQLLRASCQASELGYIKPATQCLVVVKLLQGCSGCAVEAFLQTTEIEKPRTMKNILYEFGSSGKVGKASITLPS